MERESASDFRKSVANNGASAQLGDMGIDDRICPVSAIHKKRNGEFDFMDIWYPIQVKQKDKVGRPDIDAFFRKSGKAIVALTSLKNRSPIS